MDGPPCCHERKVHHDRGKSTRETKRYCNEINRVKPRLVSKPSESGLSVWTEAALSGSGNSSSQKQFNELRYFGSSLGWIA